MKNEGYTCKKYQPDEYYNWATWRLYNLYGQSNWDPPWWRFVYSNLWKPL